MSFLKDLLMSKPLILPLIPLEISNNFAVYVLAKDRDKFWNNSQGVSLILDILKKYGFTKFWNEPILSGKSFISF